MPAILVALILFVGSAASTGVTSTRTLLIPGTVTNAGPATPIQGANVYINDLRTTSATDAKGAYVLRATVPDTAIANSIAMPR